MLGFRCGGAGGGREGAGVEYRSQNGEIRLCGRSRGIAGGRARNEVAEAGGVDSVRRPGEDDGEDCDGGSGICGEVGDGAGLGWQREQ